MRKWMFASALSALTAVVGVGCSSSEPPREAAKPIAPAPTYLIPDVNAAKPPQAEPKAIEWVNAVVLAHTESEPARLERIKKIKYRRTGECNLGETKSNAKMDVWVWGDQYRATYSLEARGNQPHTFSLRGYDSGWQFNSFLGMKQPTPLNPTDLEMTVPDVRGDRFMLLAPLTEKDLIAVVASASENEPIVRVWNGNLAPILVHLDGKTKRMARLTYESREYGQTTTRSLTIGEYVAVNGVLLPKRVEFGLGNVTQTSWTKHEYEVPGEFELSIFDKP
jgi:hypothetical protein